MNLKAKITLIVIGVFWLFVFFKGSFLHDKPGANDMALLSEARDFRNVRFQIVQKQKLPDGSYSLVAECSYQGNLASFVMVVKPEGSERATDKTPGYEGHVLFQSTGQQSDRFLEMLNDYYVAGLTAKSMLKEAVFNIKSTEGDFKKLETEPVKMELIHPGQDLDHYALFYIDMDWARDQLYLAEQNTQYRKAILLTLRGE